MQRSNVTQVLQIMDQLVLCVQVAHMLHNHVIYYPLTCIISPLGDDIPSWSTFTSDNCDPDTIVNTSVIIDSTCTVGDEGEGSYRPGCSIAGMPSRQRASVPSVVYRFILLNCLAFSTLLIYAFVSFIFFLL